jgi:C4-dicarboxylate transporter DctQ subunit
MATATISGVLVLLLALFIIVTVVMRYAFDTPLDFIEEYTCYAFVLIVSWGLNYVLKVGAHVNVDLVIRWLPPKVAAGIDLVNHVLGVACLVLLTYLTWGMCIAAFELQLHSKVTQVSLGFVYLILPIGFGLFTLELIVETVRKVQGVIKPRD